MNGPCSIIRELVPMVAAFFSMLTGVLTIYLAHERWKQKHIRDMRISDRIQRLSGDERERVISELITAKIRDRQPSK